MNLFLLIIISILCTTESKKWSEWSEWKHPCNETCRVISTYRTRSCLHGRSCKGSFIEKKRCQIDSFGCIPESQFKAGECGCRANYKNTVHKRSIFDYLTSFWNGGVSIEKRIVQGFDTIKREWPWLVTMYYGHIEMCTGSLIDATTLLTAGHCFDEDKSGNGITFIAGKYLTDMGESGEVELIVDHVIIHPKYNTDTVEYDYAIVKLKKPVHFSERINPICLPEQDEVFNKDSFCFVAGWGVLKYNSFKYPELLQEAFVPILSDAVCEKAFNRKREAFKSDVMICAGYTDGSSDACQGDSGSPLMCKTKDGKYVVAGVVSWGSKCAAISFPGVYSKVSKVVEWIRQL